ncbi:MAG: hypothetical protein SGJ26_20840 [Nitrospirota bacterium]|nr:hypothetical protein [Nitrospirota bacterium]
MEEQRLPGRSRIIAHCVREIANALPSILDGVERNRLQYDKRLDEITRTWERIGRPAILPPVSSGSTATPDPQYALVQDLLNQLEDLIKEHKRARSKTDTIAERLFQANRPENRHHGDVLRPVLKRWLKLKEWFVGHAHDNGKTDSEYDWNDINKRFKLFEKTVLTLGQGFFQTIEDIDELIGTSTPADVHLVLSQLGHIEHYRYFFENLNDPAWISAFRAEGIFRTPPTAENGSSPRWPASEFLVRTAESADVQALTDALTDIADALSHQTLANSSVIRDLVEALLKLPAEQSAGFISSLKKWVYHDSGFRFWRGIGRLTSRLSQGGKSQEALMLFTCLVAIERVKPRGDSEYLFKPVKPRINMYDYREIMKERLQPILEASGRGLLENLCTILEQAAKLSRRSSSSDEWDDDSSAWQQDLRILDEDDDVRSLLAVKTRGVAEALLTDGRLEIAPLIESLEGRQWLIFRRMAFHFLACTSASPREMIASRLIGKRSFRDRNLREEYDSLLHVGWTRLTPDEQQKILEWVEEGPENIAERIRNYESSTGLQATDAVIEQHRRSWQWRRLWPCRMALPPSWRDRYAGLVEEFGELESVPRVTEMRDVAAGERSPRTEEELRRLSPAELREYLLNWMPDRTSFPFSSRSDLSEVLTPLVKANPALYADGSEQWRELDPTYLHAIIRGFAQALQANRQLAWTPILALCSWILEQPRMIPGRSVSRHDGDPDWGGTRWWIVELLRVGFQNEGLEIPIEHRSVAWHLLEALTMDPDPEAAEDEEDFERPGQAMNRAINSVRGRAIEGLFFYPGWIKRQTGDTGPARLPEEALAVLERHLNPEQDPSLAIRSLYGRWVPWILQFDRAWGTHAVSRIFPETESRHWLIAWDGFISFNNPYDDIFEPMQPIYAKAISQLRCPASEADDTRHLRDERLASHLMTFYWRGHYPLEDESGLLRRFFVLAPDKVRAEAIEFLGRSLDMTANPIDPIVLDRIQRLWTLRLEQAGQDPTINQAELMAFGWCFGSKKFEARWAIENLLGVLRLTHNIDPDFLVLECLPDYVSEFPIAVLECVRLLIEGQTSQIELSSWEGDLRRIFMQTREHLMPEVRNAGNEVIELLGRRGYVNYGDLRSPD